MVQSCNAAWPSPLLSAHTGRPPDLKKSSRFALLQSKVMTQYCSAAWLKREVPSPVNPKAMAAWRNSPKGQAAEVSYLETPRLHGFTHQGILTT